MMKNSILVAASVALILGVTACGKEQKAGVHPEITHDRDFGKNTLDVSKIQWTHDNLQGLKIAEDNKTIYLQYEHNNTIPSIQFFLDYDHNPSTGVAIEYGADYMVENGWLYKATSKSAWGWEDMHIEVNRRVEKGKKDTIAIPLKYLKNRHPKSILIDAQTLDYSWNPKTFTPKDVLSNKKSEYIK